eukprot:767713-Hanusia_phi.AAC.5
MAKRDDEEGDVREGKRKRMRMRMSKRARERVRMRMRMIHPRAFPPASSACRAFITRKSLRWECHVSSARTCHVTSGAAETLRVA